MSQRIFVTTLGLAKACIALLALTSLTGWLIPLWPGELCSHFPLHQAGLLVVLALFLAARRQWRWVAGALALVGVHVAIVAPAWRGGEPQAASGEEETLRVASLNVYFKGDRYADTAAFLLGSKANVVVLVEMTPEWVNQLSILRTRWPNVVTEPRDGSDGIVIFSRLPILDHDTIDLSGGGRVTLKVRLKTADGPVTLIAFHPPPPTTPALARRRDAEMLAVAELARSIGSVGPLVLIGDFNCTPWSPAFRKLVEDSGLSDSRRGLGVQATWPSLLGPFGIPIDHALVSKDLRVIDRSVGPQVGSDHRGIVVGLVLTSEP